MTQRPVGEGRGASRTRESIRVAFYSDAHELGGAEFMLEEILARLSARIEATVIGTDRRVLDRIRRQRPDVPVVVLPEILTKWDLRAIAAHVGAIRRARPDVLHISLNRPWGSQWAVLGGLLLPGVKVLACEASPRRSAELRHRVYKRLSSPFLDAHVTLCETMARAVAELGGVQRDKIRTIPSGVPDLRLDPLPRTASGPVIGCLARLDPIKGIDILIQALPELPDVTAVIVGDGEERARLTTLAVELNVSDRVVFTGWSETPRNYLTTFDIYVLPSRFDALASSILEAMFAGLPVVATNVGGIADAVLDGETGLLVAPEDPGALAGAIRELLEDPAGREAMGRRAREVALERFTAEKMATDYEALYEELVS